MLQWSFGCTGLLEPISPPSISMARFEITSFAFMFDCVARARLPHDQREVIVELALDHLLRGGDQSRRRASRLALPLALFASAQARLMTPSARTMATGCFSQPIGKFMIEALGLRAPVAVGGHLEGAVNCRISVRVAVILITPVCRLHAVYRRFAPQGNARGMPQAGVWVKR